MKSFVVSTIKKVFQKGDRLLKDTSFGGHQNQTIERIKALYDMYKCMLIIFCEKGLETLQKECFEFLSIPSTFFIVKVFIVIKYSTTANQLSTKQLKFL